MVMKVSVDMTGLEALMNEAFKRTGDLTVPLTIIKDEWFQGNNAFYSMRSPPPIWEDLSPKYKISKQRMVGFVYPMALFSGRLLASITPPEGQESIGQIVSKQSLILGTKVPYAKYFHAKRPLIVYGIEQIFSKSSLDKPTNERIKRWQDSLVSWIVNGQKEKA